MRSHPPNWEKVPKGNLKDSSVRKFCPSSFSLCSTLSLPNHTLFLLKALLTRKLPSLSPSILDQFLSIYSPKLRGYLITFLSLNQAFPLRNKRCWVQVYVGREIKWLVSMEFSSNCFTFFNKLKSKIVIWESTWGRRRGRVTYTRSCVAIFFKIMRGRKRLLFSFLQENRVAAYQKAPSYYWLSVL